jgi:hypothetical protein
MYCGVPGCHQGANPQGNLDLTSQNQGNLSTIMSADYPGMAIVDPGNPMMSALYEKLQPNAMGPSGQMPLNGFSPPSSAAANIACIEAWITNYTPSPGGSSSGGGAGVGSSSGGAGLGSSSSGAGLGSSSSGAGLGSSSGAGAGLGSSSSGAGAGLGSSSSGGSGGADAGPSVTFTSIYTSIIMPVCLPCHSTGLGQTTGKLNMSTQGLAFMDLTNTTGTLGAACTGKGMLVVAGDHATSLLWEKLQPTPPCGSQMPKTGTLTAAQIAEIAAWIDEGATNN